MLRKFDPRSSGMGDDTITEVPIKERVDVGCGLELTSVEVDNDEWMTFGFEAFGAENNEEQAYNVLRKTLVHLEETDALKELGLTAENSCGYPEWLQQV